MNSVNRPSLYEVNTRVWLGELARRSGATKATLDDVPDEELDAFGDFDWIWLLGIWQTGPIGRALSRERADWRREFEAELADLTVDDIVGSPFAVRSYTVHDDYGGEPALARFRKRLSDRGVKLMLDFVPNHTALDHPWVADRPEFYIQGTEDDLNREPSNYIRLSTPGGSRIFAHGRDPYFPGWPDTLQLNYRHPSFRHAMKGELERTARLCDGLRCDMAMLVLPEVFQKTWGTRSSPQDGFRPVDASFWMEAIALVREKRSDFVFMAEAYWNLEWELQRQGFDFTYDKTLYDRLRALDAAGVRGHFQAASDFQERSVRFLENHDEDRASRAFPGEIEKAAAICAYLIPGMRFFHDGQFEGRKTRVSVHLGRRREEPIDDDLKRFYADLTACLKRPEVRSGSWRTVECREAWAGNSTWDRFLAWIWESPDSGRTLAVVNYGPTRGQCRLNLSFLENLPTRRFRLRDLFARVEYEREGPELATMGLFVDLPAWGSHLFEIDG